MARKPSNLIYGVDERPPLFTGFILGFQHVCILFIAIVLPVVIIRTLGTNIDARTAQSFISMSMLASGAATIIQALKKGPVGSGYLCPAVCGPSYFSASLAAVKAGGLPLLFGMTALGGFIEVLFSRIMHRLRYIFPNEVTGVVVAMVGVVMIPLSIKNFLGIGGPDTVTHPYEVAAGVITLCVMIGLNVWSRGKLKLYCAIIGMVFGYIISYLFGIIDHESIESIRKADVFHLPQFHHLGWAFDFSFIIPFVIATVCSTLKTVGDIVTCQKINDTEWKRSEMKSVAGGILADGLGGVIPGIIGGFGQSTSSTNIGLSIATGATSRFIAYTCGGIIITLAFLPKLAQVFIIMPAPVMGATLIFSLSFMIVTGFQIIVSRMLDARKIFVVGISIIFGLSVDMLPGIYDGVHPWIKPIFSSSLSLATVCAVILNLLLRIGIARHVKLNLMSGESTSQTIYDFMEKQGGAWGARREVIDNAISAMIEFMDISPLLELKDKRITMEASFDEFNLEVYISYNGKPLELPDKRPSREELRIDDTAAVRLSGYIIRQSADKITISRKGEQTVAHLHFEH